MAESSAIKAGEAYVELGTVDKALIAGLASASKMVDQFGKSMEAVGQKFLILGTGITAPFAAGTKIVSDFSDQMAMVGTMLDDSDFEKFMPEFTKSVRSLSVQFGEGTSTISRGLYDILSAAIAAGKGTDVLIVSMTAAQAGFTTTAIAADAITTILNSYQLSADQAMLVSDLLFATVKRGKTTFEELAQAIGQVAATASSAGLSQEEMAASLATMTRNGVKTDIAVTALNAMLMAFLKSTPRASKAAKQLGIDMTTQGLRADGLIGVLKKLEGATAEQVASVFENRRALKGIFPLLQDMEGFAFDIALAQNRLGLTTQALSRRTDTLAFKFKQLKQITIETFRSLGLATEKNVKSAIDRMRGMLTVINEWINNNREVVLGIAKLGVTLIIAGIALMGMGKSIQFLSRLLSPSGLFIGGLLAILAWGGALDGVMAKWREFVGDFVVGGRTVSEWIDLLSQLWTNLTPIWRAGAGLLIQVFNVFLQAIRVSIFRLAKEINLAMTRMFVSITLTLSEMLKGGGLGIVGEDIAKSLIFITGAMSKASVANAKMWENMLVPERNVMDLMEMRVGFAFKKLVDITKVQSEKIKELISQAVGGIFGDVVGPEGIPALEDLKKRLAEVLTGPVPPSPDLGTAGGISGDIATAGTFSARAVAGMAGMGVFNQQLNAQNQMVNLLSSIDQKTSDSPVAVAG